MNNGRFYVYTLADPRNGEVFYVGKGTGGRMYGHEREAVRGVYSRKCERIREIMAAGANVRAEIVDRYGDENDALQAEFDLIASIGLENLTNVLPGGLFGAEVYLARKAESERIEAERADQKLKASFAQTAGSYARLLRSRAAGQGFGFYVAGVWKEVGPDMEKFFWDAVRWVGFDFARETMLPHGINLVRPTNATDQKLTA